MMKTAKIIFEDDWILVVDKPAGLVVNRSETVKGGTLQDEMSEHFGLKGGDLGVGARAGIVHRLDRETSGILLIAKTKQAFENLQLQFKSREVNKEYIALVHGKVGVDEGTVEAKIARAGQFGRFGIVDRRSLEGREAKTDYKVDSRYAFEERKFTMILDSTLKSGMTKARLNYLKRNARDYALVHVFPKTGRTHQIRVHLKSIGHPVVSDLIYGPNKLINFDLVWCPRLFLHAAAVEFTHPKTKKRTEFTSGLPQQLKDALVHLTISH